MPTNLPRARTARFLRLARFLLLCGAIFFVFRFMEAGFTPAEQAQPGDDPTTEPAPRPKVASNIVKQGFPAARFDPADPEKSDSAWEIEWELTNPNNRPWYPPGCVLRIKSAKFMWKDRYGKPQWVTVARMLEIAEIYVAYDNGHTAFLDVHDMGFFITRARKEFLGPNCVAPGEILTSSNPSWSNTVYKEVHDDGLRWMSAEAGGFNQIADRGRRGEKMLLWATYYGANYRYLMEYGFNDDGTVSCRIGPTGRNIFDRQKDLGDTHLHIGCWRMEMDLSDPVRKIGGPKDNEILLSRRVYDEEKEKFTQVTRPFNKNPQGDSCEGSARWSAEEFTTLRIASKVRKNAHDRPICYDVISQRFGSVRQMQPEGGSYNSDMDFINHDFWVTRTESGFTDYINVPRYAREKRSLCGQPTTIWLACPAIHLARTEDFGTDSGTNSFGGVAITTWAGFYLKPRDLFDGTPLYKPARMRFR